MEFCDVPNEIKFYFILEPFRLNLKASRESS
jgi:hypothetical protein